MVNVMISLFTLFARSLRIICMFSRITLLVKDVRSMYSQFLCQIFGSIRIGFERTCSLSLCMVSSTWHAGVMKSCSPWCGNIRKYSDFEMSCSWSSYALRAEVQQKALTLRTPALYWSWMEHSSILFFSISRLAHNKTDRLLKILRWLYQGVENV